VATLFAVLALVVVVNCVTVKPLFDASRVLLLFEPQHCDDVPEWIDPASARWKLKLRQRFGDVTLS
jgi:hypothetical protein